MAGMVTALGRLYRSRTDHLQGLIAADWPPLAADGYTNGSLFARGNSTHAAACLQRQMICDELSNTVSEKRIRCPDRC
jgi:hypothetical protein